MKKIVKAVGPFRLEVAVLLQALAEEDDEIKRRALSGKIGGVKRRWCTVLITLLTAETFQDLSVSREKIREWQRDTFGQAVGSGKLSTYATASRIGGGRSDFLRPTEDVNIKMKELYKAHKRDCLMVSLPAKLHGRAASARRGARCGGPCCCLRC